MLIKDFKLVVETADAGGEEVFHWQTVSLYENVRSTLAELPYTGNSPCFNGEWAGKGKRHQIEWYQVIKVTL